MGGTQFSDPVRFEIDADALEGLVGKHIESHRASNGDHWCIAGRVTREVLTSGIGRYSIDLPVRIQVLRTIGDSLSWNSRAGLEEIFGRVSEFLTERHVDVVHLRYFRPPTAAAVAQIAQQAKRRHLRVIVGSKAPLYRCALAGADLPTPSLRSKTKTRNTLTRKGRRLEAEHGKVETVRYRNLTQEASFFSAIRTISPHTWQSTKGLGGLRDNTRFRKIYRHECDRGRLCGYILFAGGGPIAYQFGTIYEGVYNYEILGFHSEFARYSPGELLRVRTFDELYDEGLRYIDFGPGEYEYKARWGTERSDVFEIRIYGPSPLSWLAFGTEKLATSLFRGLHLIRRRCALFQ